LQPPEIIFGIFYSIYYVRLQGHPVMGFVAVILFFLLQPPELFFVIFHSMCYVRLSYKDNQKNE
jgi:hypothetical protein